VRDETVTTRRTEEPCADVCKAFGWRCQLPTGHGGEHVYESEVERVTWTPRRQKPIGASEAARVLAEFAEWIRRDQSHPCPVDRERVDAAIAAIGER
jgi:hypothetical protein